MAVFLKTRLILPPLSRIFQNFPQRECYSIFGIQDLVQQEKADTFSITQVNRMDHEIAINMAKQYYLGEHVLVRDRNMDIHDDRAIDEYLRGLLRQGNSLFAKAEDGAIAGFCINYAASPLDPQNLRNYAFYRQDINTKDFLYFTAKLQETPNLWNIYKKDKVFEIKMLAVVPKYRRQGLAIRMVEKSKAQALDQGYKIIRIDCINPYDYKIAERCMLSCLVKYPVHKLRGTTAPFIKRSSEHNACVRVYVDAQVRHDAPQFKHANFESMFE